MDSRATFRFFRYCMYGWHSSLALYFVLVVTNAKHLPNPIVPRQAEDALYLMAAACAAWCLVRPKQTAILTGFIVAALIYRAIDVLRPIDAGDFARIVSIMLLALGQIIVTAWQVLNEAGKGPDV